MSKRKEGRWFVTKDGELFKIRRIVIVDGKSKQERYKAHLYQKIKTDKQKCEERCLQLNHELDLKERAEKQFKIKTSFIKSEEIYEKFYEYLFDRTEN